MSRPRAVVPKYCLHKASRQAVCYVNRKPVYLGAYDSPESRRKYGELLARLAAEPTRATAEPTRPAPLLTVNILCLKYVTEELPRFSKSERDCQTTVIRLLRQTFGDTAAAEFGPLRLRVLRDAMIAGDSQADPPRKPWSRYTCNRQVKRVRAMFRWAAGWELIPVTVVTALQAVRSLSVGESVPPAAGQCVPAFETRGGIAGPPSGGLLSLLLRSRETSRRDAGGDESCWR